MRGGGVLARERHALVEVLGAIEAREAHGTLALVVAGRDPLLRSPQIPPSVRTLESLFIGEKHTQKLVRTTSKLSNCETLTENTPQHPAYKNEA